MAVKKLDDILAAMGDDVTTEQRTARLYHEIEALGDEAPGVSPQAVLEKYVRRGLDLVLNLFLDLADEVQALPEGKAAAMHDMHDALEFIKIYAIYEEMEEADGDN